jgi:O-antigen biosynthesis protein WbqP
MVPWNFTGQSLIKWQTKFISRGRKAGLKVNGRDNISIPLKVEYDEYYMKNKSFLLDLKILYMTFLKVIRAEGVKH